MKADARSAGSNEDCEKAAKYTRLQAARFWLSAGKAVFLGKTAIFRLAI
jgi:hypothetical protein